MLHRDLFSRVEYPASGQIRRHLVRGDEEHEQREYQGILRFGAPLALVLVQVDLRDLGVACLGHARDSPHLDLALCSWAARPRGLWSLTSTGHGV